LAAVCATLALLLLAAGADGSLVLEARAQPAPLQPSAAIPAVQAPAGSRPAGRGRPHPALARSPGSLRSRKAAAASGHLAKSASPAASGQPYALVFNGGAGPDLAGGLSAQSEGGCCSPSDSTGAAGAYYYVEAVNSLVAAYPRYGLGSVPFSDSLNSLTGATAPAGGSVHSFDPQIGWDPQAGRWLYAAPFEQLDGSGNPIDEWLTFGWSKTYLITNFTTDWCHYEVERLSELDDYPKLGHDNNFISIGMNVFGNYGAANAFETSEIWAVPKPALGLTTCPATTAYAFGDAANPLTNGDGTYGDGSIAFTPVPAATTDSSSRGYIVAAHDPTDPPGPKTRVMVWHLIVGSNGLPELVIDGDVAVHSYDVPPNAPQPGTTDMLDTLDARLTQAVAHYDANAGYETIWTQHTVLDGSAPGQSVVRWYELIPGNSVPWQQANIVNAGQFTFNGAISPSLAGNDAAVFYNQASPTDFVSYRAQGHGSADSLAVMRGEVVLATSTVKDGDFTCQSNNLTRTPAAPCRWGDYAAASPDQGNLHVVFGTGMLAGTGGSSAVAGWSTTNAAVTLAPWSDPPTLSGTNPATTTKFTLNISAMSNSVVSSFDVIQNDDTLGVGWFDVATGIRATSTGGQSWSGTVSVNGFPGYQYEFRVRGWTYEGAVSAWSNSLTITVSNPATLSHQFLGLYTLKSSDGSLRADDSPPLAVSGAAVAVAAHPYPNTVDTRMPPVCVPPDSGQVLDSSGHFHHFGCNDRPNPTLGSVSGPVRDFAFLPNGQAGYILTGYGDLVPFGGAPAAQGNPHFAADVARKVVVFADGTGGYVLDYTGAVSTFGIGQPPPAQPRLSKYWPDQDFARDMVLIPGTRSGYVLNAWGGLYPFTAPGETTPVVPAGYPYWPYHDIARGVFVLPGSTASNPGGYILDCNGGLSQWGSAAPSGSATPNWSGCYLAQGVLGA
jgi:hypothetical protein